MVWLLFMRRLTGAGPTLSNPSPAARQSALVLARLSVDAMPAMPAYAASLDP
jgi:hypothetical protein